MGTRESGSAGQFCIEICVKGKWNKGKRQQKNHDAEPESRQYTFSACPAKKCRNHQEYRVYLNPDRHRKE